MDAIAETKLKVEIGYVEIGWKPDTWAERLRYLAGRCEDVNPERAAELREWASNVCVPDVDREIGRVPT